MSPEEKEAHNKKFEQRVRENRDEEYQEAYKKQDQEIQQEAQTLQRLRDSLRTVIALRAKVKNISQKQALMEIQEEMKAIVQKNQDRPSHAHELK